MYQIREPIEQQPGLLSRARIVAALLALTFVVVTVCGAHVAVDSTDANLRRWQRQVATTEQAFAKTMSDRDLAAFGRFISQEAVFVSGARVLRGRRQVIEGWHRFYDGANAPFSWEPGTVEVLDSGRLALSRGPVHDPGGKLIGNYTSVWRLEAPDTWHIIFDSGCEVCTQCKEELH